MFISSKSQLQAATEPDLRRALTRQVNPQSTTAYTNGGELRYNFELNPGEVLNCAESLFLMDITLTQAGGTAVAQGNSGTFYNFWPLRLFNSCNHDINGNTVMKSSQPASDVERLYYATMSNSARDNLSDLLQVTGGSTAVPSGTPFDDHRTQFTFGIKPPLAAWWSDHRIPHGRQSITFNVNNFAVADIQTVATTAPLAVITINSIRLYARIEKPWSMPKLSEVYVPMMKLQSLPETLAVDTQSITEKTVPASTRMMFIHFAATTDSNQTPITLAAAQPSQIRINVNGQNIPNASYSNLYSETVGTQMRLYYDTMMALGAFSDPSGVPITFDEWVERPFLAVRCPSDSGSTDPNVVLDVTCAAACKVVLTPMGDSAIKLVYNNGSLVEASEVLVV